MLEFQKRVLEFKFDGEVCTLRFPSVRELNAYQRKYKESEDKLDEVVSFLISLGLSEDIANSLELPHLQTIVERLTSEKKS